MQTRVIDTLSGGASAAFFRSYLGRQPVVIADAISAWPATRSWTPAYLCDRYGDVEVDVARYDPTSRETFLDQTLTDVHARVPLRRFLTDLEAGDHTYAMREDTTLFDRVPSLLEDVAQFTPFVPEGGETPYRSLWIGPPQYVTGLHVDPGDTLLFQLYGRKTVLLFDPAQTPYLYDESVSDTHARKFDDSALQQRLEPAMLRVLRDKVAWSRVQPFSPDLTRYPLFTHAACIRTEIRPGDTLYIPDHWWHAVQSIDAAISVSVEPDFRTSPFALAHAPQRLR